MNIVGYILLSIALVLFAVLINYRFWEDGRFAILKTTSLLVIFFCLLTFGLVCTEIIDLNTLGFIWTVAGTSVTIVALAWTLSTQLTIEDKLGDLSAEYLRLNNKQCLRTAIEIKKLLEANNQGSLSLAIISIDSILNLVDSSGDKSNDSSIKKELKRLEFRLSQVRDSIEKSQKLGQNTVNSGIINDFDAIVGDFLDINTRL